MSPRIRAALSALALSAAMLAGATSATALEHGGSDPAHNIVAVPAINGSICDLLPLTSICRDRLVSALNHARHVMGKPSYALPDRFGYLSSREKLLVVANQDRTLVGLSRVRGMNAYLNRNAYTGLLRRADPSPVPSLAGFGYRLWTSNWAGGWGSIQHPLSAHYNWMYNDGLNPNGTSWNSGCRPSNRSGCWIHRHNVLVRQASGQQLALGIAGGPDGRGAFGWTELFEAFPSTAPVNYIPTVVRMSSRWAHRGGGKVITLGGFGFVHVQKVSVLGSAARVVSANPWELRIRVPAHARGAGFIVVTTGGGSSSRTYTAAFTYAH